MHDYSLEELEAHLKDEQERAAKCEDEFTKGLLLVRCKMWEKSIAEIKNGLYNSAQTDTTPSN